jgi:AraC-like DNA-binding protein
MAPYLPFIPRMPNSHSSLSSQFRSVVARILVWCVPFTIALAFVASIPGNGLDLLVHGQKHFTYTDSANGGTSRVWSQGGMPWRFGLRLLPGFAYPHAAACVQICPSSQGCDLSGKDSIVFEGRSRRQASLRIIVSAFDPGFTDTSAGGTFAPLEGAFPVERNWTRQAISLKDLPVPLWWDNVNGNKPRAHPGLLRHVTTVCLLNGMETPVGTVDTVEVRALELRSVRSPWAWGWIFLALALSGILEWFLRRKRFRALAAVPQLPPLPIGKDIPMDARGEEEARILLNWLSGHYMDEDLSVERAGREVGIHFRRIPRLLKDSCGRTFPAQVNHLRIGQAKRLLQETDRTVSEIANAVGIANVAHFHRLFKADAGMTPLEWRNRPVSDAGV